MPQLQETSLFMSLQAFLFLLARLLSSDCRDWCKHLAIKNHPVSEEQNWTGGEARLKTNFWKQLLFLLHTSVSLKPVPTCLQKN